MSETWLKKDFPLRDRHGWNSTPVYNICAINRGAIRFECPVGWNITTDSDSLKIRDLPEPDDNCVLKVSEMHLPRPIADQVPLHELCGSPWSPREILERFEIVDLARRRRHRTRFW